MSRQVVIDSLAFARESGLLKGELQIASMTRVLDLLADSVGSLSYSAEGCLGARNRAQLYLQVNGVVSLRCQRCLGSMKHDLSIKSLLEFVDDDEDLTQEELEDDSRDFLQAQRELDVVALIEDEIILSLPAVPRHENCTLPGVETDTAKISPFSALAGLKGRA